MMELDRQRLLQALALAEHAVGLSDPNPRVGCVIGRSNGVVLGQGHTQRAGEAHAEIMALRDAARSGADVRGATAWVSLEPCAHQGRTGPCCDALISAGISRVVVGMTDPFPQVNGRGIERLRAAGVEVVMGDPDIAAQALELNIGFASRVTRGRPWVRLKAAASLDGRIALPDGRSQWITGEPARRDGHAWRRRAGAVLTGVGTILRDDPRLDVRLVPSTLQPLRVVLDSSWRIPPGARVLAPPGQSLVVGLASSEAAKATSLAGSCETWLADAIEHEPGHQVVDLSSVLRLLVSRQVNEVHVEAGARLNAAFLRAGLVDELLVYLAPFLMGSGLPIAETGTLPALDRASRWSLIEQQTVGSDLRLRLRPHGQGCRET